MLKRKRKLIKPRGTDGAFVPLGLIKKEREGGRSRGVVKKKRSKHEEREYVLSTSGCLEGAVQEEEE